MQLSSCAKITMHRDETKIPCRGMPRQGMNRVEDRKFYNLNEIACLLAHLLRYLYPTYFICGPKSLGRLA